MSQRKIARRLGVNSSTISRELRRNTTATGYEPDTAHRFGDRRRRAAWKWTKRLPSLMTAVVGRLREEWSPEQISGFMAHLGGCWRESSMDLFLDLERQGSRGRLVAASTPTQATQPVPCASQKCRLGKIPSAWASSIVPLRSIIGSPLATGKVTPFSRGTSSQAW